MRESKSFVIEKGNKVFYGVMAFFIVLTILGSIHFRNLDFERARRHLLIFNLFSLTLTTIYRIRLIDDKEYMETVYPRVKNSWWFELPFFPCNTAEILYSLAIFLNFRGLLSYCFFLGFIGPILAFSSPPLGFEKENFFRLRMLGFYCTHYFCLMNIPFMMISGYYVPEYRDIPYALLIYAIFSTIMYFMNRYIDSLELGYPANYFFVMDPDFHPLFRKAYDFIPYRLIFTYPLILLVGLILSIFVFLLRIFV
ncbi:MAG: YwaF family protein [Firmicutes bacterium]|nr:YwaF family protein [Bacillota bacterium]